MTRGRRAHPVAWFGFGVVVLAALVIVVVATAGSGSSRNVVAGVVGVTLFAGIAALVLAANLSPGPGGDAGSSTPFDGGGSSDTGGGADSGGGGDAGGGGDGGGGSW